MEDAEERFRIVCAGAGAWRDVCGFQSRTALQSFLAINEKL